MTEHNGSAGTSRNPVTRIVRWLRAGYPEGVPQQDYVALLGILHRDLTDQEIEEIASVAYRDRTGNDAPADQEAHIGRLIRERVHEEPAAEDIARVASRLAAGGWPIMPVPQAVEAVAAVEGEANPSA